MTRIVHGINAPCGFIGGGEAITDPEESGDVTCPICLGVQTVAI